MNHIEQISADSPSISLFARGYFDYLSSVLGRLNVDVLDRLEEEFKQARARGNTIFVTGNGGSATTATSMANDLGFDVVKKTGTTLPFRVFALTDNTAVLSAIANDVGYEDVFVNQLAIHYRDGDKLIVISASGNSPNVVRAAEWVKQRGGTVIGFLGFDGGMLKDLCDLSFIAKTQKGEYGPVEDVHLILNHVLAHWFQSSLKGN